MKLRYIDVSVRNNYCFLCLNSHKITQCSNYHLRCFTCENKHNTLLHEESKGNNACTVNCENVFPHTSENKNHHPDKSFIPEPLSYELKIKFIISFNNSKHVYFQFIAKFLLYNTENKAYYFRVLLYSFQNIL